MRLKIIILIIIFLLPTKSHSSNTIAVLYPNGGEIISTSTIVNIKWKSDIPKGQVAIILYSRGVKFLTISKGSLNNGMYAWRIPENIQQGNNYRIRIRLIEDLSVNDFSDKDFMIIKK